MNNFYAIPLAQKKELLDIFFVNKPFSNGLLQFIIPLFSILVKSNRLKNDFIFININFLFSLLTTSQKRCIIL